MRKLNVAILGTGSIATGGYAPALQNTENAQLWSVLSRDINRGFEFTKKFGAKSKNPVHTSLDSLLQDPDLDAVIVATPDKLHAQQAVSSAKAGKHILLEKPLATDAEGISQILDNCSASKITLALCYRLRWHAGHRAIVKAVHETGELHQKLDDGGV